MAENIKAEIFGEDSGSFEDLTATPPDLPSGPDAEGFDTDFSDFQVALSDDDLDAARSAFKVIPSGTRINLSIIRCERGTTRSGKRKLVCDFQLSGTDWGKNRRIRFQNIIFDPDPEFQWRWGQFLKATGYVDSAAQITPELLSNLFADPGVLVGRELSATVIGHSWKQRPGTMDPDFPRDYGSNAQTLPSDGTRVFEDLSTWAPVQASDTDPQMRGLAEFVSEASSLETYL